MFDRDKKSWIRNIRNRLAEFSSDQRGITGLETAIVLIAFVVVAAVFAFTILTTGLFATEKAKESAQAGLSLSGATLAKKGATFLEADGLVETIKFKLSSPIGTEIIDLAPDKTLITYSDSNQKANAVYASVIPDTLVEKVYWNHEWPISGTTGPAVDPGEVVEFTLDVSNLNTPLMENSEFNIEVIPAEGAVVPVSGLTPLEIKSVMVLP
jgi:flagellin FlaB